MGYIAIVMSVVAALTPYQVKQAEYCQALQGHSYAVDNDRCIIHTSDGYEIRLYSDAIGATTWTGLCDGQVSVSECLD